MQVELTQTQPNAVERMHADVERRILLARWHHTRVTDAPLTQSRPTLRQVLVLLEGASLLIRLRELARAEDKLSSAGSANNGGCSKP